MIQPAAPIRSKASLVVFVFAIYLAMMSVPYLIPAPLSISRSYISGFSNRTAIILLFTGTVLFAAFTKGSVGIQTAVNSCLRKRSLGIGLLLSFLAGLHFCGWRLSNLPGGEALYFTNRTQLLLSGVAPYRGFEFVYGPLLLYPIGWIQRFFHLTTIHAYDLTWLAFWQIGVIMLWVVVRGIDLPLQYRGALFSFLLGVQLAGAIYGGLSYTPFRAYLSSFCIVIAHRVWELWRNSWLFATLSLGLVVLCICCSMDQAIGAVIGIFSMMVLLCFSSKEKFSRLAAVSAMTGTLALFWIADRMNLTEPLRSFGGGGYSYPLLPSLGGFLIIVAYVIAGCFTLRALYARFAEHCGEQSCFPSGPTGIPLAVPLTLAGCSMIPNALGRCDLLHISAAIPVFVVGVAAIFTIAAVRRWWLPSACLGLIIMPYKAAPIFGRLSKPLIATRDPLLVAQGYTKEVSDNQFYVSPSNLTESELPCDRRYFSPSFMPISTERFLPQCLDTGYYLGVVDVITVSTIAAKLKELQMHRGQPLLMESSPLEAQLPLQLTNNESLYSECETIWVPKVRNAPLTYAPIIAYIREHYRKGPLLLDGRLQVWEPTK